jgi:hypothetical protein
MKRDYQSLHYLQQFKKMVPARFPVKMTIIEVNVGGKG